LEGARRRWMRVSSDCHHHLRFKREAVMPEERLRDLIGGHGFTIANLSSPLTNGGKIFEYRMVIRSRHRANAQQLVQHLLSLKEIIEFRISPTGTSSSSAHLDSDVCGFGQPRLRSRRTRTAFVRSMSRGGGAISNVAGRVQSLWERGGPQRTSATSHEAGAGIPSKAV
jgi:hypothetical protein